MRRRALIALAVVALGAAWVGTRDNSLGYAVRYLVWKYAHAEHAHFSANGVRLHYLDGGAGTPLIFLHGGGAGRDAFFAQLPYFARTHRVIALDSRDHGASTRGEGPLSYALYARDVVALLDHLGLAATTLIGWSDGGNTALRIALDDPGRVCRLVLMSANFHPAGVRQQPADGTPPQSFFVAVWQWLRDRFVDHARAARRQAELATLWRTLPAIGAADLASIAVPTLILGGKFDVIDPAHLRAMHAALPDAVIRILPEVAHGVPYETPADVNHIIDEFLRQQSPAACAR